MRIGSHLLREYPSPTVRIDRERCGCEFRRNPARDSDLMSATVPI
jgi:hypothetical protein